MASTIKGASYDAQGNLRDWWTSADAKAFEARAGCIADQLLAHTVAGDTKINGKLTLGKIRLTTAASAWH